MSLPTNSSVLIIGLGLIGGSVARGLRNRQPELSLLALDRDQAQLDEALAVGVIHQGATHPAAVVPLADLIVIAVPTLAVREVFTQIRGYLKPGTVLTDVASVKQSVVQAAEQELDDHLPQFVPGHPIAGSEKSGFSAADGDLFVNRNVILTPVSATENTAVQLVHSLWRTLDGTVLGMSVAKHDQVLAATSHLPHLLSYTLVDVLNKSRQSEDIFRYAAGGFTDFSRLASSDPIMWADIFTANAEATTAVLDEYVERLIALREAMLDKDYQLLRQTFAIAKSTRDNYIRKLTKPMSSNEQEQSKQIDYRINPGGSLEGQHRVPGDKSISHRAIIFGSLAEGVTRVSGFLEGEDALNTLQAFRELGVMITGPENGQIVIYGVGMQGLTAPRIPLYMGNSGTAMRLLSGVLAAQNFSSELTGDESLSKRPMKRIVDPLQQMGAAIEAASGGTPPLRLHGNRLRAIDYTMPMASAQVKSCLLLAAMYADGETIIRQPAVSRDHTERMLTGFGYPVTRDEATGVVKIGGGHQLKAATIDIPGDISSAAFFLVGAAIAPGSQVLLEHVGVNPTRTGIINLLQLMGADIELRNETEIGGEPVADLLVTHTQLQGIDIPEELIPLAIDEFPALFIAAACAEGTTRLRGAGELRVKESDRLQAMADGLKVLGIENRLYDDGIDIVGGSLRGGEIDSQGDHRIAMAFAMAALRCSAPVVVRNCANVATSFPGFAELAVTAGLQIQSLQASGTVDP